MNYLRDLIEEFFYPIAFFLWLSWYWLVPLAIVIGVTLSFFLGLTLRFILFLWPLM